MVYSPDVEPKQPYRQLWLLQVTKVLIETNNPNAARVARSLRAKHVTGDPTHEAEFIKQQEEKYGKVKQTSRTRHGL